MPNAIVIDCFRLGAVVTCIAIVIIFRLNFAQLDYFDEIVSIGAYSALSALNELATFAIEGPSPAAELTDLIDGTDYLIKLLFMGRALHATRFKNMINYLKLPNIFQYLN